MGKIVYCIEYEIKYWGTGKPNEHHKALYTEEELADFIARVKRVKEKEYIDYEDIKVSKAELVEFDINKVLNPF